MKKILQSIAFIFISQIIFAQTGNVGIGTPTPDASAILEISDANAGLLIPRVELTSSNSAGPITSPAISLLVYNISSAGVAPNNVTPGYYYWSGTRWQRLLNAKTVIANNGLSIINDTLIQLGGAITQPTTISGVTATNKLSVTATGVDAINFDANTLSIDATNDRLGIGTNGPTAQLHSTGTVRLANYPSGLLAADATGLFTSPRTITGNTNQIVSTNGNGVSGDPTLTMDNAYAASVKAGYALTGGGNITYSGGYLKWSNRFIVINNGNGSQFSSDGYFDISLPGSGVTITGVGGTGNVTTTTSGIPMSGWQALYYVLPIGSSHTSATANFRLTQYNSAFVVPENWVLVATLNDDDKTMKMGNGVIIKPGMTWGSGATTIGNGGNTSWVMSANIASSEDDLGGTVISADGDDDNTYQVALPFSVVMEGVTYTYLAVNVNGWAEFETGSGTGTPPTYTFSETALPAAGLNGPTVFAYWDDLKDYGGGEAIRSQTFGTSPNRTHVIDWKLRALSSTVYNVFFQMEIHEGSNVINVKYHTMNGAYNGQSATIGFQLAGGSSAKAFPLVYDGKILDDNATNAEGWSVSPLR